MSAKTPNYWHYLLTPCKHKWREHNGSCNSFPIPQDVYQRLHFVAIYNLSDHNLGNKGSWNIILDAVHSIDMIGAEEDKLEACYTTSRFHTSNYYIMNYNNISKAYLKERYHILATKMKIEKYKNRVSPQQYGLASPDDIICYTYGFSHFSG